MFEPDQKYNKRLATKLKSSYLDYTGLRPQILSTNLEILHRMPYGLNKSKGPKSKIFKQPQFCTLIFALKKPRSYLRTSTLASFS